MKKLWLWMAISVMLSMTACNTNNEVFSVEDMAVTDADGNRIAYGMTRSEVEKILGEADLELSYLTRYPYWSLVYRDDVLVGATLSAEGWKIRQGVEIGSTVSTEFLEDYGWVDYDTYISFVKDSNSQKLTVTDSDQVYDFVLIVSYNMGNNDNITDDIKVDSITFGERIVIRK